MKTVILNQEYSYAEIVPYRNYSNISERKSLWLNTFSSENTYEEYDDSSLFGDLKIKEVRKPQSANYAVISLYPKDGYKKKNTKYFYSDNPDVGVRITLKPYNTKCRQFITDNDRQIKNHFNKPFSGISLHKHIRRIELSHNKLTVRIFRRTRNKTINSVYFKKNWASNGFTIDLNNGDFYTFDTTNKNKRIRKNSFNELKSLVKSHSLFNYENRIKLSTEYHTHVPRYQSLETTPAQIVFTKIRERFRENLNDLEFKSNIFNIFKNNLQIDIDDVENDDWVYESILKFFIKKKGIKVPNNYVDLLTDWYPTVKYLKKNDNKLVASILDRLGVKSKHTIKLVHELPELDLVRFSFLRKYFFGNDLHKNIGNLNRNVLVGIKKREFFLSKFHYFNDIQPYNDIQPNEQHCILKLLNNFVENRSDYDTEKYSRDTETKFREIDDHLNMIRRLKRIFPETEFKACDWKTFHEEHLQFSRLYHLINRGYTIEFIFDDDLIKTIEEPITTSGATFYPVILKKDIEYTEEGKHMHHCVGSYSERETSLIVSLRENGKHSDSRVTCEYNTMTKRVVQERSFCNGVPPEQFLKPLEILRERIGNYRDSIKSKEKVKTPFTKQEIMEKSIQNNGLPF